MKKVMFLLAFSALGLFASDSNKVKKGTSKMMSQQEGCTLLKGQAKFA